MHNYQIIIMNYVQSLLFNDWSNFKSSEDILEKWYRRIERAKNAAFKGHFKIVKPRPKLRITHYKIAGDCPEFGKEFTNLQR